ncbi:MAG: HAD family phosphatase [Luteolibacter sp.]|uniref:HAD family hydrolase n=1 Tax=Luteolibacter sp. TaxID=1962973 RepID=UPI003263BF90
MTFLFDIGRVLLDFDFESSMARLFPSGVTDPAERMKLLIERKDEFEAGKIETDDYIAWALEALDSPATSDEFRHAWQQIFTPNEPMWQCVRQLAADGHRLILFSNINGIHWPWITEEFPEFSLFHDAVVSYKTGFIKPQPEIYQHAIGVHDLDPAETLYIDDLPQNIATGRELGFRTWQYDLNDHPAFESWLAAELTASKV